MREMAVRVVRGRIRWAPSLEERRNAKSPTNKICTKCHRIKRFTEFYAHPNTHDLMQSHCKDCAKEYWAAIRERMLAK